MTQGKEEPDGSITYQGVDIKRYQAGIKYFEANHTSLIKSVEICLQNRIKSQDTALLSDALTILQHMAVKGLRNLKSAIENLSRRSWC